MCRLNWKMSILFIHGQKGFEFWCNKCVCDVLSSLPPPFIRLTTSFRYNQLTGRQYMLYGAAQPDSTSFSRLHLKRLCLNVCAAAAAEAQLRPTSSSHDAVVMRSYVVFKFNIICQHTLS